MIRSAMVSLKAERAPEPIHASSPRPFLVDSATSTAPKPRREVPAHPPLVNVDVSGYCGGAVYEY